MNNIVCQNKKYKGFNWTWVIFPFLLYLPFFSYTIPFVDRSVLNVISIIFSLVFVNSVYSSSWKSYKNILILTGGGLLLFIQFSKTGLTFSLTDGMATFLRYIFYISVITLVGHRGISKNDFHMFCQASYILCFLSIIIGLIGENYVFLNGQNRFNGATHSAAALSMQLSIAITLMLVEFIKSKEIGISFSVSRSVIFVISFIIFLYALIETGSRQPLLGLTLTIFFVVFVNYKRLLVFIFIPIFVFLISYIDSSAILEHRFLVTLIKLWNLDDLSELSTLRDSSILARLNYFIVGIEYIINHNLMFGAGLNAFPGIYEIATGKAGVAPHNDLLLLLVEFGYIGGVFIILPLMILVLIAIKKKNIIAIAGVILWVTGFSLNNVMYYHPIVTSLLILFLYSKEKNTKTNMVNGNFS